MYLRGVSNTGKSLFVEYLIGCNKDYVYYPGVGKFFMQDFDPSFHKLIVFEEIDIKYHVPSMLKRLLEGRSFAYSIKGLSDKVISFRGPIIFVSNFYEIDNIALQNWLKFIYANCPYWEDAEVSVPKMENGSQGGCVWYIRHRQKRMARKRPFRLRVRARKRRLRHPVVQYLRPPHKILKWTHKERASVEITYCYGGGNFDDTIREVPILNKVLDIPSDGIVQAHYQAYDRIMINRIRVFCKHFSIVQYILAKGATVKDVPAKVQVTLDTSKVMQVLR